MPLFKSEFGKNVFTLIKGATIAQFLPIAFTPLFTRLFSPEEFGVFALYMSFITFLAVISTGRYEQAVVLPKTSEEAINVLVGAFVILIGFTVFLYLLLLLLYDHISTWIQTPSLDFWLWMLPLGVMFTGGYRILTFWSNRHRRFTRTSSSVVTQSVIRVIVQTVGGFGIHSIQLKIKGFSGFIKQIFAEGYKSPTGTNFSAVSYLVGSYIVGIFFGFLVLLFPLTTRDRHLFAAVNKTEIKKQLKRYEKFPKINMFHAMSDEFKNIGVNSTILYLFSDKILGFFSMTTRILRGPLNVIGNSFGQVFFQKAAELHANEKSLEPLMKSTLKKMFFIALPIFGIVFLFGPVLFEFVLGEKWRIAGQFVQYLTPWLMLNFIIGPVLQVAVIFNKQEQYFIISLIHNIVIIGSIFVGGYVYNDLLAGFVFLSCFQVVFYLLVLRWVFKLVQSEAQKFT